MASEIIKLKYDPWGRKFLVPEPDTRRTTWSDDEDDGKNKDSTVRSLQSSFTRKFSVLNVKPSTASISADTEKRIFSSVSQPDRLPQIHKKQHSYSGEGRVEKPRILLPREKLISNVEFSLPMPHVAVHSRKILGAAVDALWQEFIDSGADTAGYISYEKLLKIKHKLLVSDEYSHLNFDNIREMDLDEFITFRDVIDSLSDIGYTKTSPKSVIAHPYDCACHACIAKTGLLSSPVEPMLHLDEDHALHVIYNTILLEKKGRLKVRDIPSILQRANISFDRQLLPDVFWHLKGDFLLSSMQHFDDIASLIRTDKDGVIDEDDHYNVPKWLQREFTEEEIEFFKHHFMMIDVDKGGSIDAEELQLLTESLGLRPVFYYLLLIVHALCWAITLPFVFREKDKIGRSAAIDRRLRSRQVGNNRFH
jgi:hypothetical protein